MTDRDTHQKVTAAGHTSEFEPVNPWLRRAWLTLVSLCLAFIASHAYERYTEYRAERVLEAERNDPTDTSEMSEEEALQHRARLTTTRNQTALGKWLQEQCREKFTAHEEKRTPESHAEMQRYCRRHTEYLETGTDPGLAGD